MRRNVLISKILIIGDSGVGKTSLFNRIIGNGFCPQTPATIGVDFHSLDINIDKDKLSTKLSAKLENFFENFKKDYKDRIFGINNLSTSISNNIKKDVDITDFIKIQLWDAAGQEKFRNIIQSYYRNSSVIFLVFDHSNRQTFEHLTIWIEQILNSNKWTDELPLFFLIGNKNDLQNQVNQEEIDLFCNKYKITSYYSVSAKKDEALLNTIITSVAHEVYFHIRFIHELNNCIPINDNNNNDNTIVNAACCLLL